MRRCLVAGIETAGPELGQRPLERRQLVAVKQLGRHDSQRAARFEPHGPNRIAQQRGGALTQRFKHAGGDLLGVASLHAIELPARGGGDAVKVQQVPGRRQPHERLAILQSRGNGRRRFRRDIAGHQRDGAGAHDGAGIAGFLG